MQPANPELIRQKYNDSSYYNDFAMNSPSWRHLESVALTAALKDKITEHTRIFDIGYGNGRIMQLMKQLGASEEHLSGMDISDESQKQAQQRLPKAHLLRGDASTLELPPESIDVAVSCLVIQYFDGAQMQHIAQMLHRALTPGGYVCMLTTHEERVIEMGGGTRSANNWYEVTTPWGLSIPNYAHSKEHFEEYFPEAQWELTWTDCTVSPELAAEEPRYAHLPYPLRVLALARKR